MAGQLPPALVPADPFRWHESVLSTRSLSYMSTISALGGANALPSPLASRNPSLAHIFARRESTMTEDSEYELELNGTSLKKIEEGQTAGLPESVARSILFRLPLELRERIYQYCLVATDKPRTLIEWPKPNSFVIGIAPALLQTCKLIFLEAAPFLYANNSFTFHHPSDANIFVRCMSSPLHSGMITSIHTHVRQQDIRIWAPYFTSNESARSLRHDFPSLRELIVRFRSAHWIHTLPVEINLRRWHEEKPIVELLDGLASVYYPSSKNVDVADSDADGPQGQQQQQQTDIDGHGHPEPDMSDAAIRDVQTPDKLEHKSPPHISVICMCRVHYGHFETLTGPQRPLTLLASAEEAHGRADGLVRHLSRIVAGEGSPLDPAPVQEGDEFTSFSPLDLLGRAYKVPAVAFPGGTSAWAARTVFANRKNIMLALEIFTYDNV